jgi:uncharacterized protein YheU (UPF0270 family)
MAEFVSVPLHRLQPEVLLALLEEFVTRDGTDYGEREHSLEEKVQRLDTQLRSGDLQILYDVDSEQWDIVTPVQAEELLNS